MECGVTQQLQHVRDKVKRMTETVLSEIDSRGVLRITLNRPAVHNAFSADQIQQVIEVLRSGKTNPKVRLVVLAGAGKSFSAGGDLGHMRQMGSNTYQENFDDALKLARMFEELNSMPQPTIAKVQGAAYGGGVGLVCCCDITIGSDKARFCLSEVKLGMAPATIAPYVITAIGVRAARRYCLSAEVISAERARELGILGEVVEHDALDQEVENLIDHLLKNAPIGMQRAKGFVVEAGDALIDEELIQESAKFIAELRESDEAREGLSAFLDKRPASWIES